MATSYNIVQKRYNGTDYDAIYPVNTYAQLVTLSAAGWVAGDENFTQTVNVTGVLADESKQLISPMPAIASMTAYYESGVLCTGQAEGSLTFSVDEAPTEDLSVYVTVQLVYT